MKDWLLSIFGEWFIKRHVSPYGRMTSFHINTQEKKILFSAELRGEVSPIQIEVDYARREVDGSQLIYITGIRVSREWAHDLANTLLQQAPQSFPIPAGLVSTAVRVLNI